MRVVVEYMGLGTTRKWSGEVTHVDPRTRVAHVAFASGPVLASAGDFSLADGWGVGSLASWRLSWECFTQVRTLVTNPPVSRWESRTRRPWMPKKERRKKQAVEDARQRKIPF